MGFRFALASVLKVKQIIEERQLRQLEATQYEICRAQNALVAVTQGLLESEATQERELHDGTRAVSLQYSIAGRQSLWRRRKELENELSTLRKQYASQLSAYENAKHSREVLSQLQDQKRSNYKAHQLRVQQQTTDDLFLARKNKR